MYMSFVLNSHTLADLAAFSFMYDVASANSLGGTNFPASSSCAISTALRQTLPLRMGVLACFLHTQLNWQWIRRTLARLYTTLYMSEPPQYGRFFFARLCVTYATI